MRLLHNLGTHLNQVFPICELHLSFDGIVLMHHADGAWARVQSIDLDPDTLERDMADLHTRVQGLCHGETRVNLVLPAEQIKFLTLDHDTDMSADQITGAIEQELEHQTPYSIAELRYDYITLDAKVHVAAVAIETLQEAEEFATAHGFDVVASRGADTLGGFETGAYFGRADDPAGASVKPVVADIPDTAITPTSAPTNDPVPAAQTPAATPPRSDPIDSGATVGSAPVTATPSDTDAQTPPAPAKLVAAPITPPPKARSDAPPDANAPSKSEAAATLVAQKLAALSVERAANAPQSAGTIPGKRKPPFAALAAGLAIVVLFGLGWSMMGSDDTADTDTAQPQAEITQTDPVEQISLTDPQTTPDNDVAVDSAAIPNATQQQDAEIDATPPQTPPQTTAQTSDQPTQDAADQAGAVTYSDQDVQRIYAATGIWVRGPDRVAPQWPEPLGDVYIASIDVTIELQDAVALPSPQSYQTDTGIRTPAVPAPAGTIFELNALGLVQATTQGALAPEGYTVFLGRPSVTPPENPQADSEPVLNDTRSLLTTNGTPLIDLRPRPRPALSVLEAPAQQQTDALALLRPKTRPDTISALSEAMATPAPDSGGLNAVPTPKIRPSTLQTTALSPEEAEGDEAAVTTAAPRIPSNAKVSEEATIQNALKLNDLNLIGVFGSGSNKRALVRFANGKRQMVSVGDRLDGGKVAAIGDTELRYVKGGRNVVLKLPRG